MEVEKWGHGKHSLDVALRHFARLSGMRSDGPMVPPGGRRGGKGRSRDAGKVEYEVALLEGLDTEDEGEQDFSYG